MEPDRMRVAAVLLFVLPSLTGCFSAGVGAVQAVRRKQAEEAHCRESIPPAHLSRYGVKQDCAQQLAAWEKNPCEGMHAARLCVAHSVAEEDRRIADEQYAIQAAENRAFQEKERAKAAEQAAVLDAARKENERIAAEARAKEEQREREAEAQAFALHEKRRIARDTDKSWQRRWLTAMVCFAQEARRDALAAIAKEHKYGRIGGVVDRQELYGQQTIVREADERIEYLRGEAGRRGVGIGSCPGPLTEALRDCYGSRPQSEDESVSFAECIRPRAKGDPEDIGIARTESPPLSP